MKSARFFAPLLLCMLSFLCGPHLLAQNQTPAPSSDTDDRFRKFLTQFPQSDLDKDGILTREEVQKFNAQRRQNQDRQQRVQHPAPTHADVSYGDHQKQAFDLWLADSKDDNPTPLAIYIHGGGFRGGDKSGLGRVPVQRFLDAGISFASMNYRLSDVGPYPMQMEDAARGLQLIRSRAKKWNLDPEKIACFGGSAGAGISLWLAFGDDRADPDSDDPVARQSTRIVAAATMGGQSTYDIRTFREWFDAPELPPHPALEPFYAVESEEDWESARVQNLMEQASAITHLTKDDPPVFMTYSNKDVPVDKDTAGGVWVHHVRLGLKLKEAMDKLGIECIVTNPEQPADPYEDLEDFITQKLLE